jgi:cell wall assembly regulator SMI1
MTLLIETLNRFMNWVELKYPIAVGSFITGLTNKEIDNICTQFSFSIPLEIRELYQWRNGQRESYAIESVESISNTKNPYEIRFFDGMTLVPFMSLDFFDYDPFWIVICEDEDGYYLVIDLRNSNILRLDIKGGADDYYVIYKNLTAMMQTLAEFYESGGDIDGVISFSEEYQQIWLKYNSEIGEQAIKNVLSNRG